MLVVSRSPVHADGDSHALLEIAPPARLGQQKKKARVSKESVSLGLGETERPFDLLCRLGGGGGDTDPNEGGPPPAKKAKAKAKASSSSAAAAAAAAVPLPARERVWEVAPLRFVVPAAPTTRLP